MALIERFTPGGNLWPDGSSTFATLVQFFRRHAEVRDTVDAGLRTQITAGDTATLDTATTRVNSAENRAKAYADEAAAGVLTTATTDTTAKVAAGEARTRTYTDTKAGEVLADAHEYTDVSFAAAGAGGATDAQVDAAVNRGVLAGRVPSPALLPENGAQAVGKGELVYNVRDFGAKGDGVTDDGPAIQAAIDAAITANPNNTVNNNRTVYYAPTVFFPPGVYYVATAVAANINPNMIYNVEKRRLFLKGAANDSVFITMDANTAPVAFSFWRGFLTIEDIHFDGMRTYTGVMLEMGKTGSSQYLNQFQLNRLGFGRTGPGGTCIRAPWAFDGTLTDILFLSMDHSIGIDLPAQEEDNCNNWAFRRVHMEMGINATFIRARSHLGPMNFHTNFSFDQCHLESRSYDTRLMDLEGCSRWTFISPHLVHSNSPTGDQAGITHAQAVSPIRLVNCNSFQFISGAVTRQGAGSDSWPTRLLSLGGNVRGLSFRGTYFYTNTATGMTTASKPALWQSDPVTPLSNNRGAGVLSTEGSLLNSYTRTEMFDELSGWGDSTSTSVWSARFDAASKRLVYGYGTDGNDVAAGRVDLVSMGKDGGLTAGYYGGLQATIPNGATHTFTVTFDNNPNRRGIYLVYANDGSGSYALVFNAGSTLDVIAAGNNFAVGNTHPQVDGKYNLFVVNTRLTVANLRGFDRAVAVVPFGLF